MPTAPRHCAFCGSTANLHREHVFPKWLSRLIFEILRDDPRNPPHTLFRVHMQTGDGDRVGTLIDVVTKRVCKACNTGWMSCLEDGVKPILTPLLREASVALSPADQAVLSQWAAKTAMTVDLARTRSPHRSLVPERHCGELMRTAQPPRRCEVWLAAYQGEHFGCSTHTHENEITFETAPDLGTYRIYALTINVLGVLLQLVGDTMPEHWTLQGAPQPGPTAHRIWPPHGEFVTWPPPETLDDDGLAAWTYVRPPTYAAFGPP